MSIAQGALQTLVAIVQFDGTYLKNVGFGTCVRNGVGSYTIRPPFDPSPVTNELFITSYLRSGVGRAQINTQVINNAINVIICNDAGAQADLDWGIKVEHI